MKTKKSFIKSFGPLLLAAVLLVLAFGGSVALASFDRSQSTATHDKGAIIKAVRVELANSSASSQAGTSQSSTLLARSSDDGNTLQPALQPGDDKSVTPDIDDDEAEETVIRVVPGLTPSAPLKINFEFSGQITAINGNVLTIGGRTVQLLATTEVKGSLMVGEMAKVEGFLEANGSVQAAEIKAGVEQEQDDEEIGKPLVSPTPVMGDDHGGAISQPGLNDHGGDSHDGGQSGGDGHGGGGNGGGHD